MTTALTSRQRVWLACVWRNFSHEWHSRLWVQRKTAPTWRHRWNEIQMLESIRNCLKSARAKIWLVKRKSSKYIGNSCF